MGFRPFDSSFVASSVLGQPEAVQNKFAIIKTGMEGTGPISSLSHDGITGPSGPAVYLLSSETEVYTGSTVSLSTRWPQHQSGKVFHTRDPVNLKKSAFKPIAAITGFRTIGEARWFELLLCYANEPDFWLQYSNIEHRQACIVHRTSIVTIEYFKDKLSIFDAWLELYHPIKYILILFQ